MPDLQTLKERIDLLSLAGQHTRLKRVASSGGGEWAGPCPFCGGRDRFHLQPHAPGGGRWLCRQCTGGRWQDAITFGQRLWPALPFREVVEALAGARLEPGSGRGGGNSRRSGSTPGVSHPRGVRNPDEPPAYQPPGIDWQAQAHLAVETCARKLWEAEGAPAREYLHSRRLANDTLRLWQVGFSPGARFGDLWVPRGVLIPCLAGGEVWYLKVALLPGDPVRCQGCQEETPARRACPRCGSVNKYRGVRGNRTAALFGADELVGAWGALFVEGEFDALLAWQELHDVIAVCTLGSAANLPDLATWGPYLLGLETILAVYDADEAGRRGLVALQELSSKVQVCLPPAGAKDLNEYVQQGGELWPWLRGELLRLGLVEE